MDMLKCYTVHMEYSNPKNWICKYGICSVYFIGGVSSIH